MRELVSKYKLKINRGRFLKLTFDFDKQVQTHIHTYYKFVIAKTVE